MRSGMFSGASGPQAVKRTSANIKSNILIWLRGGNQACHVKCILLGPKPATAFSKPATRPQNRPVPFFLTHWTKSRSRVTSSTKNAPGTISVSICVLLKVRTESVTSATPSAARQSTVQQCRLCCILRKRDGVCALLRQDVYVSTACASLCCMRQRNSESMVRPEWPSWPQRIDDMVRRYKKIVDMINRILDLKSS
jgi:hypothetical protein